MDRSVRCYAHGRGQDWQAICVDFDLAVHGTSFREVKRALETSLQMYLEAVAELPPEERALLLARKAPWYVRAKLAWMTWLYRFRGDDRRSQGFVIHSHLPAHP